MVLSHDDANDILQDVFIKAWTNLENFRGESKLTTWLYRIAINESITFLNKKRIQNNISIDDDNIFLLNTIESDEYFDGDEAQKLLQKAILTLPDKQRLVFQMKYFEEMKYEDMSEILGTSVGALKASYHHAVKKIEKILGETN
jgi:RNA polymerase sigma-70 factor (ECF subfamily)